jgi:hypothetical protein
MIWKDFESKRPWYNGGKIRHLLGGTEEIYKEPLNNQCHGRDSNRTPLGYNQKRKPLSQPDFGEKFRHSNLQQLLPVNEQPTFQKSISKTTIQTTH